MRHLDNRELGFERDGGAKNDVVPERMLGTVGIPSDTHGGLKSSGDFQLVPAQPGRCVWIRTDEDTVGRGDDLALSVTGCWNPEIIAWKVSGTCDGKIRSDYCVLHHVAWIQVGSDSWHCKNQEVQRPHEVTMIVFAHWSLNKYMAQVMQRGANSEITQIIVMEVHNI